MKEFSVKKARVPLCDLAVSPAARKEVAGALKDGWLSTGPRTRRFEAAAAKLLEVKNVLAVNSATSGLFLTLKGMGIQPDDEVITTPYTFVATAETIIHCGARPVFVDIDPVTLTMDPASLAHRISRQTRLVIPVDIAGYPCDYKAIKKVCSQYRTPILSDSAHAFGTLYKKRSMPHWADASVYSFYSTKNLTMGEGGLIASKDKKLIDQIRLLSRHGMSSNAYQRSETVSWEYDVTTLGYKANLSDIQAAIALGQLTRFKKDQAQRMAIATRYGNQLSDLADYCELPSTEKGREHSWHLYVIRLRLERLKITRNRFIAEMAKLGIECGVHYKPVTEMSYYKRLGYDSSTTPVAQAVWQRVVSLPMYAGLPGASVDRVCDAVRKLVIKHRR
jgi:dTDP-4-amino-4,6-dideoxygalactose transaminase